MKSKYLKSELWDEQLEAVAILPNQERHILADSTGLGKTLSILASFIKLYEEDNDRRLLIVGNKSSLATWASDIPEHTQGLDYLLLDTDILNKSPGIVRILQEPPPPITFITYSALQRRLTPFVKKLYQSGKPVVLALEEAHYFKNPKAARTKSVKQFVIWSKYCWALTATPIMTSYLDLWGLFDLLLPGYLGTEAQFKKRYMKIEWISTQWKNGKKVVRKNPYPKFKGYINEEELKEKTSVYILKRVKHYNIKFHIHPADFTQEEEALYTQSARGILLEDYKGFAQRLPELQLVTDNTILADGELNKAKKLSSKEKVLFTELIEKVQTDHKAVIIFSAFKKTLDRLQFLLEASRLNYRDLYRIDGNTPSKERMRVVQNFGEKDILLISPAGRESLNLQVSNHLYLFNLPFSLSDFVQLCGRIARSNSIHDQFNIHLLLVKNTIDEYKARKLLHRTKEFTKILAGEAAMPKTWRKVTRASLAKLRKKLLWRQK